MAQIWLLNTKLKKQRLIKKPISRVFDSKLSISKWGTKLIIPLLGKIYVDGKTGVIKEGKNPVEYSKIQKAKDIWWEKLNALTE